MKILSHFAKGLIHKLASSASIRINGDRPWDVQAKDERSYQRILFHQNLGLGKSYMDKRIECKQLDEFIIGSFPHKLHYIRGLPRR